MPGVLYHDVIREGETTLKKTVFWWLVSSTGESQKKKERDRVSFQVFQPTIYSNKPFESLKCSYFS